jgi:RNA polymerase sigma factor (sigma-70 family)
VGIPHSQSNAALLRAARRGDKPAFAALVERHYPALLTSCRRVLRDTDLAGDASQEAVLRAMLGLDHLRNDERFGPWLIGIGLNVCRSLLNESSRRASSLEALRHERRVTEPLAPEPEPPDHAEASDHAARVRAAIADLPPGQREAVVLFYLGGLTHAEIADELGTQPGAIKTRLHKARKSLRAPLLSLYKERIPMTDRPADLIPMHVAELRRTAATDPMSARHIVFLKDDTGDRRLPIWIGPAEAIALAVILDDVQLPRPGAYQFAAALLTAAGGQLREVRIIELTGSTFYAQAVLADGATVDARPSDALTLALVTDAPIRVAASVLHQAATQKSALSDLFEEADRAPDDAHAIADEVRTRLAASAAEIAERQQRTQ